MEHGLLIGEVAARSGVSRKAIRLYEARGILPPPRRTPAGYRRYPADVLRLLAFVGQARRLGLSLSEIKPVVALRRDGAAPCLHIRTLSGRAGRASFEPMRSPTIRNSSMRQQRDRRARPRRPLRSARQRCSPRNPRTRWNRSPHRSPRTNCQSRRTTRRGGYRGGRDRLVVRRFSRAPQSRIVKREGDEQGDNWGTIGRR